LAVAFDFGSPAAHANRADWFSDFLAVQKSWLALRFIKDIAMEGGWVGEID